MCKSTVDVDELELYDLCDDADPDRDVDSVEPFGFGLEFIEDIMIHPI